jgi:hypothetical protein
MRTFTALIEMITHFHTIIYAHGNVNDSQEHRKINLVVTDGLYFLFCIRFHLGDTGCYCDEWIQMDQNADKSQPL